MTPHPCSFNITRHSSSTTSPDAPYSIFDLYESAFAFYHTIFLDSDQSDQLNRNISPINGAGAWNRFGLATTSTTASSTTTLDPARELKMNLNKVTNLAYFYFTPIIIAFGLVGDILSIAVLSHPLLKKTSVVYSYLLALAVTDLLTLISVIPMILWIMKKKFCSYIIVRYYANVGFPLANAFMGASVYIVVFLTFNQYMAVCHPFFRSDFIRSRKNCLYLTLIAYALSFALYVPWAWRKNVRYVADLDPSYADCPYEACDNHSVVDTVWYKTYQWTREMISRFIPFILIAYFNLHMLYVYKRTRTQRMSVVSLREQKMTIRQKMEREQRRLWALLFGIMTLFFVCTIPAAPFTIMVTDRLENNLTFQTIRAITNVLEFTKFALNFYLYCMINPDIRRLCVKRLTCHSSINSLKAPLIGSRNSYHLSDLLQMSERRNTQQRQHQCVAMAGQAIAAKKQQLQQQQQQRKSGVVGMSSLDNSKSSRATKRNSKSRQDSERPLLLSSSSGSYGGNRTPRYLMKNGSDGGGGGFVVERSLVDEFDYDSRTSQSVIVGGADGMLMDLGGADDGKQKEKMIQRNGNVGKGLPRRPSDAYVILHGEPPQSAPNIPSKASITFSAMFNDESIDELDLDNYPLEIQPLRRRESDLMTISVHF